MIELPRELESQLEKLAQKAGTTKENYTYNVIVEHLEDMDDLETAQQAALEAKNGKTYTLEQVMQRLK